MRSAVAGCSPQIWNASDLIEWVESQAVKEGCDPATVELDEWYSEREDGNHWLGTCVDQDSGETVTFSIGIDAVWTPSE